MGISVGMSPISVLLFWPIPFFKVYIYQEDKIITEQRKYK